MPRREPVQPRSNRRIVLWLVGSSALVLVAVAVLRQADVQLGQGSFVYRYSQLNFVRLLRCIPALLLAAAGVGALWLWSRPQRDRRRLGAALAVLMAALLAVWTWWGPPAPITQHTFNLSSPSHEGAFLFQAQQPMPISRYLRGFDRERLRLSIETLGGTRVLSNPPGTTILFRFVINTFPPSMNPPGALERWAFGADAPTMDPHWSNALRASFALAAMWGLSALTAYGLGRELLSPIAAAAFATIVLFNPCAVLFSPGKDPAQLLTVTAMLWGWLAGWRRASALASAAAGALLVVGSTMGLIHIWIALAAAAAVGWHEWSTVRSLRPFLLRHVLPAAIGAFAIVLAVLLATGWNIPATLFAVWRRFAEVQPTFNLSRPVWLMIGLPIFLLFLSPGLVTTIVLALRRFRRGGMGLGMRLLVCTIIVMALTYAIGVPYELPRLWVVFIPPLALGAMIDVPLFHGRSTWRTFRPLAAIVGAQIVFTALHWTMFDVRESEYRLLTHRMWSRAIVDAPAAGAERLASRVSGDQLVIHHGR
jgi:hypothetical protein